MKGDFKIINKDKSLFLHAPTLQVFKTDNEVIKKFIHAYEKNIDGKLFSNEQRQEIFSFIEKKICAGPKTIIKQNSLKIDNKLRKQYILPIKGSCNLACEYCFAHDEGSIKFDDYSEKNADSILEYIVTANNPDTLIDIVFFGGEPLLNFSIIKYVVNKTKSYENKFSFSITTNGTILSTEIIEFVKKNNITVLFSLDGNEQDSKLRRFKNGTPSFKQVINNVNILKKHISFQIRSTISCENESLLETIKFLEDLKIPYYYTFIYKSGNKEYKFADYSNDDFIKIRQFYLEIINYFLNKIKNGEKIYCNTVLGYLNRIRYRDRNDIGCEGGVSMLSITADGSLYSCQHLVNYPEYSIGNINSEINSDEFDKYTTKPIEEIEECKQCWARYLCGGGCFSEKLLCGHNTFQAMDNDSCELEKIKWESMIYLFDQIKNYNNDFFKHDFEKVFTC
jgi:radical SAM protein with 4Fe4S-binding SPASM domain